MSDFLQSIIDRDPAAKSKLSLILTYPGVKAVFFHRIANFFSTTTYGNLRYIYLQSQSKMLYSCPRSEKGHRSPSDTTLSHLPISCFRANTFIKVNKEL